MAIGVSLKRAVQQLVALQLSLQLARQHSQLSPDLILHAGWQCPAAVGQALRSTILQFQSLCWGVSSTKQHQTIAVANQIKSKVIIDLRAQIRNQELPKPLVSLSLAILT